MKNWLAFLNLTIISILFSACSNGGSDNKANSITSSSVATEANTSSVASADFKQGVFVDSPVEGLEYKTQTQSGITDANGQFYYLDGETVSFSVGDIQLGSAVGQPVVTPMSLVPDAVDETDPVVVNVLRFLQTLDDDGDPSNGITITQAIRELSEGETIDFDQNIINFGDDGEIQTLISTLTSATSDGTKFLVEAGVAISHFQTTLDTLSAEFDVDFSLTLEGADTNVLGTEVLFDTVISGHGQNDGVGVISATGSGSVDNPQASDANAIVVSSEAVIATFVRGGEIYNYVVLCVDGTECDGVIINEAETAATFDGLVLEPSESAGEINNEATGSITVSGTMQLPNQN